MTYVLGTSAQALREAPLLLVDVETEEGVTGRAYQFCYVPQAAPAIVIFLDEVLRRNRQRQIVIHCIGIGTDAQLLKQLAKESGGIYKQVK